MKLITLDSNSNHPKYKQIVHAIEVAIATKRLTRNDKLPSVNKVRLEFSISRDTVLFAYDELKKRGIIYAILGKGYYVKSTEFNFKERYFLLFDELNVFKEDLFNSFLQTINDKAQVDLFFHHFNPEMFKKLIQESNGNYTKYIIMPTNLKEVAPVIKSLPKNDVYILDQTNNSLKEYPSVHQNFVKDMYESLLFGLEKIKRYHKLILIFPGLKEPTGMVEGFEKFCAEFNFNYQVVPSFDSKIIEFGEVYVIPNDRHLVEVIEQSKIQNIVLGSDFGIISYNDTPLKKVVEKGITTISTNFIAMGQLVAEMVLSNEKKNIENACALILRKSL